MNEIQREFVNMLDTYQQCFGSEREGGSYCYLGLAYELYRDQEHWTFADFKRALLAKWGEK